MSITSDKIKQLFDLAAIAATPDEVEHMQHSLGATLEMIDQIKTYDTEKLEPLNHPLSEISRYDDLREDCVTACGKIDQLMTNAEMVDDCYRVPAVIDSVD